MNQVRNFCNRLRKQRNKSREEKRRVRELRLSLPDADTLDDAALSDHLWRALEQLASMQVVMLHTDHLSDRDLYTRLAREVLQEKTWPTATCDACHVIDMAMGQSMSAIEDFFRYYADEQTRRHFATPSYGVRVPARKRPPYDRDRRLASLHE